MTVRARDLAIPFDGTPGLYNAITDVPGVEIGHSTLITDQYATARGVGRVRTGVTVIHPKGRLGKGGVAAGRSTLNGTGEWTGMHLVDEIGRFYGPIALTGTGNLGTVHSAMTRWSASLDGLDEDERYMRLLAVVAETLDAPLNDVFATRLSQADVFAALDGAAGGRVAEGNVGGGTGMIAYEFKGGVGTASRVTHCPCGAFTIGVLVQANHARRSDLTIAGVRIGAEIDAPLPYQVESGSAAADAQRSETTKTSLLMVLATDAPLLPHQLQRLARRAALGVGRNGSTANNLSGELALAFATVDPATGSNIISDTDSDTLNALFAATVQAVEEALVNQLVASSDMIGDGDVMVHAIKHRDLVNILKKYNRFRPQS